MKNILLNWMPPSMVEMPSPAMSVLKQFLVSKGYNVSICYWNIKMLQLQKEFVWCTKETLTSNDIHAQLLFNNYLAIKQKDKVACAKIKSMLIALKPQYLDADLYFFDKHMEMYARKLDILIDEELENLNLSNILYLGMSANLYQWISGSIIAKKIKKINPNILIVIGGIGTKESAVSFLRNFEQFDIALWGEGEYNLLELTNCLSKDFITNEDMLKIPNLAYREGKEIIVSGIVNHTYVDLNSSDVSPDFDDYFEQLVDENKNKLGVKVNLFIEGSRSCHWRRCKFCYLNTGYKHRLRNVITIENQIRSLIEKYKVYQFSFLDNDIIANNWERFAELLDSLSSIKDDYPDFQIVLAEIITKDITSSFIRKMSMAGFKHVQIGYESASNTLLNKINKKNTFASNLLFIKYACKYNILVGGANIICGLLEETNEDILEGIENLRSLRFFFEHGKFRHTMSRLSILNSSRYYKEIDNKLSDFMLNNSVSMLPENYISKDILSTCTITEMITPFQDPTWSFFSHVESYYLQSEYKYKIYEKGNILLYKEYLNGEIINELEIEYSSLDYLILKSANQSVLKFQKMRELIVSSKENENITDCELYHILGELKKEGLIYTPCDYSEIITIPDVENII